jgi:hypothetical protein
MAIASPEAIEALSQIVLTTFSPVSARDGNVQLNQRPDPWENPISFL